MSGLVLLAGAFLMTVVGTWGYRSFARRRGIIATPIFRSLHQRPTPRGGGIVFSLVCLSAIAILWLDGTIGSKLALAVLGGGLVASVVGFVDDTHQLSQSWKLVVQGLLAAWVLLLFDARPLVHLPETPAVVDLALSWLSLVWLMNLCNFIDGIDAMAATAAAFVSIAAIVVLSVASATQATGPDIGLGLILGLIAVCCAGFLVFNWPPASIFMGDSGSLFVGFIFGVVAAKTILDSQISTWTWLIIFGYLAGDTSTTTGLRMLMTRKWYAEHRSHAYQNLARLLNSHLTVVVGVSLYHFAWLLPLAVWSTLMPPTAPIATALALSPVVLWTIRHGPLRSRT
jgi:glycosyltransferase WbpL